MTAKALNPYITQPSRPLVVPAVLLALGIIPVIAGLVRLAGLMTGQATAEDARFFEHPWPIATHIAAVIPYALLGALQFARPLQRRLWHRVAGAALVPLGLVAALSGLWMTCVYPWPQGDGEAVYLMRLVVGTAMTFSIVRGVVSLVGHDYAAHGAWMLRGYALGMGAGTQVITHLPWFVFVGTAPGVGSRAVMMGLAWVINVAVAEYIIRTGRTSPADAVRGSAPSLLASAG